MSVGTAELWFAGKRMDLNQKLAVYVGSNEKTKVVVALQELGDPRPQREKVDSHIGPDYDASCTFQSLRECMLL